MYGIDTLATTVALASYPRSGNSLLRLLLERLTGLWTGSIYQVSTECCPPVHCATNRPVSNKRRAWNTYRASSKGFVVQDARLREAGWRGEGFYRADQGVVFVKTHDPMFPKWSRPDFAPARAIYIVRNPYEAIRSYFHLETGGQHNQSLTEQEYVPPRKLTRYTLFRLCPEDGQHACIARR